jgi:hypothetical protein
LRQLAVEAASACHLGIAGVDLIVTGEGEGYVLEVNATPSLRSHQFPPEGEAVDVASMVFDELEKTSGIGTSPVIGCFETVSLPRLGVDVALAKIDTGAFSGAIHATDIKVFKRGRDQRRILKFTPIGDSTLATETHDFLETYVRSSTGHRKKRFIISTDLVIGSKTYQVLIGLSDRSDLKTPILLGRRFLRENGITVDVRINQELDDDGEATT